jgi:hypothetical protein
VSGRHRQAPAELIGVSQSGLGHLYRGSNLRIFFGCNLRCTHRGFETINGTGFGSLCALWAASELFFGDCDAAHRLQGSLLSGTDVQRDVAFLFGGKAHAMTFLERFFVAKDPSI